MSTAHMQVGISDNCNNPPFCGADGLGDGWGWIEFDRFADGTITSDAQVTGCGHFRGDGGGAFHADIDITSAHIGPSQPQDANYPSGQVFYVDHNVVNGVTDGPEFLGDTGGLGESSAPAAVAVALVDETRSRVRNAPS